MVKYHWISFLAGFLLDLILGDPYFWPHPVRAIGSLIDFLDKELRLEASEQKTEEMKEHFQKGQMRRGAVLVLVVLMVTVCLTFTLLFLCYRIHPIAGVVAESILSYQVLAMKCLKKESMKVYERLKAGDLPGARKAVSMIVGRDTQNLDETGVAKAAIETVAENTSDGVIAPMLYLFIGGPVFGLFYKAINTMDSMIGYQNETYLYFGRVAARLDDVANYLPARMSAWLMIAAAAICNPFCREKYLMKNAVFIYRRDKRKHKSPNSAHTEAVCAGALGIQLAGDASYFGKVVKKPFLGDAGRMVEIEDIRRANRLLYQTAFLCEALCLCVLFVLGRG